PTAVIRDRPSCEMARPSSEVGPDVICSGAARLPFGENRCRNMWNGPSASELMYIHFPSGDHCAKKQAPFGGPTWRPGELWSTGTNRQGSQSARSVISDRTTHLPSGDGNDRCAIAPLGCG